MLEDTKSLDAAHMRVSNSFSYFLLNTILSLPTPFGVNKYTNMSEIAVYPVEVDT